VLLLPNVWLHPAWCAAPRCAGERADGESLTPRDRGKLLFCAADLAAAWLVTELLSAGGASAGEAWWSAAASLLNPLTLAISTRGSCDSLLSLLQLLLLRALQRRAPAAAGGWLGAAVHLRLFPAIHALPLGLHLLLRRGAPPRARAADAARFALAALAAFALLTGGCSAIWGGDVLRHAFLYHASRSDPRHNFAPAFYPVYLAGAGAGGARARAEAALAQLAAVCAAGLAHSRDPPAALFFQTLLFVTFNRVITAQYFAWWAALLPLLLPRLAKATRVRRGAAAAAAAGWAAAQLYWLACAAQFEFGSASGEGDAFVPVWRASLLFLFAQTGLAVALLAAYRPQLWGGAKAE